MYLITTIPEPPAPSVLEPALFPPPPPPVLAVPLLPIEAQGFAGTGAPCPPPPKPPDPPTGPEEFVPPPPPAKYCTQEEHSPLEEPK